MYKVSYHNLTGCTTVHKDLDEVFDRITDSVDFEDEFDDIIDDEEVVICGVHYFKSHLLKEADPVAYRCYLADYMESGVRDDIIDKIINDLETKGFSEKYGFMITTM